MLFLSSPWLPFDSNHMKMLKIIYWLENGTFFKKKSLWMSLTRNTAMYGCLVVHILERDVETDILNIRELRVEV